MLFRSPFFLSVNYPDAHGPWLKQVDGLPKDPLGPDDVQAFAYLGIDPPPMREAIANHYNCMGRLDSLVGDLLAALERSGKADNTLVIYFGDHGADFLRGKRTSYEGGVRVPLIIRWPKQAKSGQVREELVSTVDLMPTLLAVAQAEPVSICQAGRSYHFCATSRPIGANTFSPNFTRMRPVQTSTRNALSAMIATS